MIDTGLWTFGATGAQRAGVTVAPTPDEFSELWLWEDDETMLWEDGEPIACEGDGSPLDPPAPPVSALNWAWEDGETMLWEDSEPMQLEEETP